MMVIKNLIFYINSKFIDCHIGLVLICDLTSSNGSIYLSNLQAITTNFTLEAIAFNSDTNQYGLFLFLSFQKVLLMLFAVVF